MDINHSAKVRILSKMKERLKFLHLMLFITILFLRNLQGYNSTITRNKRYLPLIYTNPAAITFITGFGIPVHNLNPELVTVGMVFKAQQFLPTRYEALRHQANHSIHKRAYTNRRMKENVSAGMSASLENSRTVFYKALEQLSTSLGQSGSMCVLKMICEVAAKPFHYQNGVLGEIMHILLTPSSSVDISELDTYHIAERNGHNNMRNCDMLYRDCNESILDRITSFFD